MTIRYYAIRRTDTGEFLISHPNKKYQHWGSRHMATLFDRRLLAWKAIDIIPEDIPVRTARVSMDITRPS